MRTGLWGLTYGDENATFGPVNGYQSSTEDPKMPPMSYPALNSGVSSKVLNTPRAGNITLVRLWRIQNVFRHYC